MESINPRRGEIWLASLGAGRRGEPGKTRPVVVISSDQLLTGDEHELIVIVPFSSSLPDSQLRPRIGPETGIDEPSAAICRGIRGVARTRLLRHLGEVDDEALTEIEGALGLVLGTA